MTITLPRFRSMTDVEKIRITPCDRPVAFKEDDNCFYVVYQVWDFFVELQSDKTRKLEDIAGVKEFSATEFLQLCLKTRDYYICDPMFD